MELRPSVVQGRWTRKSVGRSGRACVRLHAAPDCSIRTEQTNQRLTLSLNGPSHRPWLSALEDCSVSQTDPQPHGRLVTKPLHLPTSSSRRVRNGNFHRRESCISSSSAPVDGPASTSYLNYSLRATQRQPSCVLLAASSLVLASPSSLVHHYQNPIYAALSSRRLLYHLLQRSSH